MERMEEGDEVWWSGDERRVSWQRWKGKGMELGVGGKRMEEEGVVWWSDERVTKKMQLAEGWCWNGRMGFRRKFECGMNF